MLALGVSHSKSLFGVSFHPTHIMWRSKNHKDQRFPFFKIPSSSVFVLTIHKVLTRIPEISKIPCSFVFKQTIIWFKEF